MQYTQCVAPLAIPLPLQATVVLNVVGGLVAIRVWTKFKCSECECVLCRLGHIRLCACAKHKSSTVLSRIECDIATVLICNLTEATVIHFLCRFRTNFVCALFTPIDWIFRECKLKILVLLPIYCVISDFRLWKTI